MKRITLIITLTLVALSLGSCITIEDLRPEYPTEQPEEKPDGLPDKEPEEENGSELVLNELCASGEDSEKYIELYNPGNKAVSLKGYAIRKDEEMEMSWEGLEDQMIPAKGFYAIVGAKGTTSNGFNSGFSAKKNLIIELYAPDGKKLDTFQRGEKGSAWGDQSLYRNEGSWSRLPDGSGMFMMTPVMTPGTSNNGDGAEPDYDLVGNGSDSEKKPSSLKKVSVAEFIDAPESRDVWYELTGEIINIASDAYGNLDISDGTGEVYIYGLTNGWVGKNDKSFASIGLKVGDIVTMGALRSSYNDVPQGGGPAYYISHIPGDDSGENEDESSATDLTYYGQTANCYVVSSAGMYKFKTVKGNSSTYQRYLSHRTRKNIHTRIPAIMSEEYNPYIASASVQSYTGYMKHFSNCMIDYQTVNPIS